MCYAVIPYQTYLRPWAPASLSRCMFLALKIMPGTQWVTDKVHRHRNICVHGRWEWLKLFFRHRGRWLLFRDLGRIWIQRTFTLLSPQQESGFRDYKGRSLFRHRLYVSIIYASGRFTWKGRYIRIYISCQVRHNTAVVYFDVMHDVRE